MDTTTSAPEVVFYDQAPGPLHLRRLPAIRSVLPGACQESRWLMAVCEPLRRSEDSEAQGRGGDGVSSVYLLLDVRGVCRGAAADDDGELVRVVNNLVLSIFPGIDLLGRSFEQCGFCVVRGPDLLWGGDIHSFHPPAGVFGGIIGGPPCQAFSRLRHLVEHNGYMIAPNLIPEYERVVSEAQPDWFCMENVPAAPHPVVQGYVVESGIFNNRQFGAVQNRERSISIGTRQGVLTLKALVQWAPIAGEWEPACLAGGGRKVPVALGSNGKVKGSRARDIGYVSGGYLAHSVKMQGLPEDFDLPGLTLSAKVKAVNNGVPMTMGLAIAQAIRRAMAGAKE